MNLEKEAIKPRIRHKTFTYKSQLNWTGHQSGLLDSDGKQSLFVSSPPEFKGSSGHWTPEDMFVASVETCTMLTFLALAHRNNYLILSYSSKAEGILEFVEGDYRFTTINVHPIISVADMETAEAVEKIIPDVHRHCIITNSIRAEVNIKADVRIASLRTIFEPEFLSKVN
jgi:organic hydroperoxide reductase OsmC/OhrA